jgi:hypothetical protein
VGHVAAGNCSRYGAKNSSRAAAHVHRADADGLLVLLLQIAGTARWTMRHAVHSLFVLATMLASAAAQSPPKIWPVSEAPADVRPAIERADAIITAQHSALLRQLTRVMSEGGAALAIQTCHLEATSNAMWVERRQGYAIGRTSDRLRSPTNAPKAWALPIVRARAGQQIQPDEGYVADLGNRLGILRPIAMRPACESCHGQPEKIPAAVLTVLRDRYPKDRAVGFKPGEIRGWYWIELPRRR